MKLLLDLNGRKVVEQVIDRVKAAQMPGPIIICTSTVDQDAPLCEVAEANNIECFRGDPEDVLQRTLDACDKYKLDGLVGITGENPLFVGEHIHEVIEQLQNGADLVKMIGMPIGCAIYGISKVALQTLCTLGEEEDTSMWGYLLNRPEIFDVRELQVDPLLRMPEKRLTIDYPEDLQLMRELYDRSDASMVQLTEAMELLRKEPALWDMNAHREQEDMDQGSKDRIERFFLSKHDDLVQLRTDLLKRSES